MKPKYHLYVNERTGERLITKNDFVWKVIDNGKLRRLSSTFLMTQTFMAGDTALDNGFECKGEISESEIFAELL